MRIENGWLTKVNYCVSPHFDARPQDETPSLLVIHNISLPPGEFGGLYINALFTGTLDESLHPYFLTLQGLQVSAHCLIRRDGEVVQYVSFDNRAWHAGISRWKGREKCNDFSIGIELEGTDTQAYTEAQYGKLQVITRLLMQNYPIERQHIVGHSDIAPGRKTDPGEAFNWHLYFDGL